MMAEGRFASLPRSLHAHHTIGGGTAHPGRPSSPLSAPSNSSTCPRMLQNSLASSMDLLGSRPGLLPGQGIGLSEKPAAPYQPISIHGTLPRRRKGGANLTHGNYTWDPKANHIYCESTSLPVGHLQKAATPPVVQTIVDDFHEFREPSAGMDAVVDYVKTFEKFSRMSERCNLKVLTAALCCFYHKNAVINAKFSRDQFILDCPPEKLRKELEEELKMNCKEPRSHAWYHGAIPRQVAENLVQRDGDFLIRDSLSSPGSYVLTCQWRNAAQHFKINKKVVMLNEAYSRIEYRLEREGFDSVPALIRYYVGNRKPVSLVVGAIVFQPINRGLPLRCLEEKYGLSGTHRDTGPMALERRNQKRLSLNITNGHVHDNNKQPVHESSPCQDGLGRSSQLRMKDRCGSQPASLNHVQERRRPLKAHQSESFLPLGSRVQPQQSSEQLFHSPNPKSPVFRTGSEPVLSPSASRRAETLAGQPIRGSDSQLCPKPPPKPSKVPLGRLHLSINTDTQAPGSPWRKAAPPAPPLKLLKSHPQPLPDNPTSDGFHFLDPEMVPCELSCWERPSSPVKEKHPGVHPSSTCSYVERLKREAGTSREEEPGGGRGLDRSSYHHAIAALENTSEEEEEDAGKHVEDEEEAERRRSFQRPVVETESTFQPAAFPSRLLPPENKPLEMVVLKKAKELLLGHDHHSIATHLLMADCQVARILGVSAELRDQMGVSSGLELVTLPHGRQLRLDLMERHHTMAIGVAVDILGCTGSVEERASTLNRIILVAMELKDVVGDLFAFTALMKALELQQITRLEETWTSLRRNFTQTAISYEKTLKPFYKNLYEGSASPPAVVCVPLLLPLLTLMERPSITSEGAELWETSDQGCDIMLRHLEAARDVAQNAQSYMNNAQKILDGFQCDEDLLEVFQTDFHLRLLWGSRGATVNQSDRYSKFNLILTALSRKLEPPPKTQTLI